ncbi:hypothetical protein PpBr36_02448 [Pyricularia pennisetigena]|uniref:hypothetical protein n=1 Tax=Pyricularia pennisetigena TaxID=1578925 RepID=UPI00114EEE90|nr:hypothetical protein PpBr36_02448 [Pyricularia pennisetigena]TLS30393.1 hypothetical protein PpBr36_02448 [Pyricularia pennisetigena]
MQLITPFAFLILAHFTVALPTESFADRIRPIEAARDLDAIPTHVDGKSESQSTSNVFPCFGQQACHLNSARSVENKALKRRAGPGDKKKKKAKKQKSNPGSPTGYHSGVLDKTIDGLRRHAAVVAMAIWDGYINLHNNWKEHRAKRKENRAKRKAARKASKSRPGQAPVSRVTSEVPNQIPTYES